MILSDRILGKLAKYRDRPYEYACNALLASFYILSDLRFVRDFIHTHRFSSLVMMIFETAIVFFSLTRPLPKKSNTSLYDWTIAMIGTFLTLLMIPAKVVNDNGILLGLQTVGALISLAGLFSLRQSWGLVAANRGIRTGGMYRVIRHPIYAGYFLSCSCFLIQNLTPGNMVVFGLSMICELLRIYAEEKLLSQDPEYVAYMKKTRWRVIPLIY